jgi:arylsulfatase A-like enzyme
MELFDKNGTKTPNIEKLANSGIIFTHAFSNAPVSSAARSTLISGCYGPRIASHYHRKISMVPMPGSVEMFPAYLRKAGYYTTNNFKEDYNIIKSDSVWDESSREATWRNRREGQPFFHVKNIGTTHESRVHFTKEFMDSTQTITSPDSCFLFPYHPKTRLLKYTNALYRDKIREMDSEVGEIVVELEKDGLLENTFIFYFSDHGGVLPGSKGYLAETGLHVPLVVYIPPRYKNMVNMKPGSRCNGFVSFIDFGATVLNLAGVDIPFGIDGKPFLGKNIKEKDLEARNETFGYADRMDEKYDMVRSLRIGKYKYIRNYQPFNYDGLWNNYRYIQLAYREWLEMFKKGELNDIQAYFFRPKTPELLFDVEADPYETNNLAGDPSFSSTLMKIREKMIAREKEMPDLSFFPEHYLIEHAFNDPAEFGQEHERKIHKYIDIANLMLSDFQSVRSAVRESLGSGDPWERYWAIIVCSSFREEANEMIPLIKNLSQTDTEYINRVRSAEFLGIIKEEDPEAVMVKALYGTNDPAEALLILNSIVLMKDGFDYSFIIQPEIIIPEVKNNSEVIRRLEYLSI